MSFLVWLWIAVSTILMVGPFALLPFSIIYTVRNLVEPGPYALFILGCFICVIVGRISLGFALGYL